MGMWINSIHELAVLQLRTALFVCRNDRTFWITTGLYPQQFILQFVGEAEISKIKTTTTNVIYVMFFYFPFVHGQIARVEFFPFRLRFEKFWLKNASVCRQQRLRQYTKSRLVPASYPR